MLYLILFLGVDTHVLSLCCCLSCFVYINTQIVCYTILPGQLKQHIEVAQEQVPVRDNGPNLTINPTFSSFLNVNENTFLQRPAIMNDPTTNPGTVAPTSNDYNTFEGFAFDYINFLNNHDEFCELWIAKCPLVGSCIHYLYN